jgi:hypothetical protein
MQYPKIREAQAIDNTTLVIALIRAGMEFGALEREVRWKRTELP